VNASLITGLSDPSSVVVSGSDLFVAQENGTIGEYTTSGAVVNASLVTGLGQLTGIAVDVSDLFVVNSNLGTIGEYTISGATVNASLITGISSPQGIVIEASSTPEPNSIALLGLGLASLEFLRRKRIKA